jgi:hypothetical protein
MTEGNFTKEQLDDMGPKEIVALLRRNSGDADFHWRVREAVLNRAAEVIEEQERSLQDWRDWLAGACV